MADEPIDLIPQGEDELLLEDDGSSDLFDLQDDGSSDLMLMSDEDMGEIALFSSEWDDDEVIDLALIGEAFRGPSAYEVAVTNGFVGTEAEWLASLVGAESPNAAEARAAQAAAEAAAALAQQLTNNARSFSEAAEGFASAAAISRAAAESFATDAGQGATASQEQRVLAETARTNAEAYSEQAAQAYQNAEEARAAAQTAEGLAVEARNASQGYATAAAGSRQQASGFADQSRSDAQASRDAHVLAEAARQNSNDSAVASFNSAATAAASATDAEARSEAAQTSRLAAEAALADTNVKAQAAVEAWQNAEAEATTAGEHSIAAAGERVIAETAAGSASVSAGNSASSASDADGWRLLAQQHSETAVESADLAGQALSASITAKEQAEAYADESGVLYGALASRATTLESQVNTPTTGILARTASLELATLNLGLGKADATRVALVEANVSGKGWLHPNAEFTNYPRTDYPEWWTGGDGSNIEPNSLRVPGENGTYAWRVTGLAAQNIYAGGATEAGTLRPGQWVAAEADFTLVSGDLLSSGIFMQPYAADFNPSGATPHYLSFSGYKDSTGVAPGAGVVGRRYRFRFPPFQINGTDTSRTILYAMTHWSGFGPLNGCVIDWHLCGVRPATPAEIEVGQATAGNVSLSARFAATELASANLAAGKADVSRVALIEARAVGTNLLKRSQLFDSSFTPWSTSNYGPAGGIVSGVWTANASWAPPGEWPFYAEFTNAATVGGSYQRWMSELIPVEVNKTYCLSAYSMLLGPAIASSRIVVYLCDINGNYVTEASPDSGDFISSLRSTNGQSLGAFKRIFGFWTNTPGRNAFFIRMVIYSGLDTVPAANVGNYAWMIRPMVSEAQAGQSLPPSWASAAVESRVTVSEQATADLYGRTQARWQIGASVPGATAFIQALAETTPGAAPTSSVAIGAYIFAVFNPIGGDWKKTLEAVNGNVMFSGGIQATTFIRLGSGVGWPIARGSVDFSLTDGEVCDFGTNLGSIPNLAFAMNNLAALSTGETYNVYAEGLTATGFTLRAKISIPAASANQSVTGASTAVTIDTFNGRRKSLEAKPDSADGTFRVVAAGTQQCFVEGTGGSEFPIEDDEIYVTTYLRVYALKASVWTLVATTQADNVFEPDNYADGTAAIRTQAWYFDKTITVGTTATEIAVVVTESSNSLPAAANALSGIYWQSAGTGSGVRSATPSGQKTRITVRPQ